MTTDLTASGWQCVSCGGPLTESWTTSWAVGGWRRTRFCTNAGCPLGWASDGARPVGRTATPSDG